MIREENCTYGLRAESPIGTLLISGNLEAVTGVYMNAHKYGPEDLSGWIFEETPPVLLQAEQELDEYFAGSRQRFEVKCHPTGSPFQMKCWDELTRIPFGETLSYGVMAKKISSPDASRAVGAANGRNPISIIVPCHRVIGATGKLVGFGGGLPRKAALLGFERAISFGESASEFWDANPVAG